MNKFWLRFIGASLIVASVPTMSQASAVDPVARGLAAQAINTIKALQITVTALQAQVNGQAVSVPTQSTVSTVSGTPAVGNVLTAVLGTYTGNPSYAYQWQRGGTNIAGQTANTYTAVSADAGLQVGYRLTATNSAGSAVFQSSTVLVPAAGASTPSLDFSDPNNSQYVL